MTDNLFSAPIAVKFVTASMAGEFTGYGSTWGYPADSAGDIIAPGAFARSLAEHKTAGTLPALLYSHDPLKPIGVFNSITEDAKGLKCSGKLTLDVQLARDTHALMKSGAIGLSIGYRARDTARLADGVRMLKDIGLHEVSCVAMPANSRARITSVKTKFNFNEPRVLESILCDAGYPRAQAKSIVAHGKAAFRRRDAGVDAELIAMLREGNSALANFL